MKKIVYKANATDVKTKKHSSKPILYILLIVSAIAFVISGFMLFSTIIKGKKEQAVFDQLSPAVNQIEYTEESGSESNPLAEYYFGLKEKNSDFIGWIKIDGTQLDYPVMHTPENPEYYLRRTFDKSYSLSGTPFMDAVCTLDDNAVMVYGHHMNNGTMFAALHNYKDESFWKSHKTIVFDTVEERRTYEIVSAFYTEVKEVNDTASFKYYKYIGNLSAEDFDYYCRNIKAASIYDTGVEIAADDKLITLSTCSDHHEYGRLVVVARLKDTQKF